jgi:hypothetical protein
MTRRNVKNFKLAKEEANRLPDVKFISPDLAMIILQSIPNKEFNNGQVVNTLKFVLLAILQDSMQEMDKDGDMKEYDADTLEDMK